MLKRLLPSVLFLLFLLSPCYSLSQGERQQLTVLLSEYKEIQRQYKEELTTLQLQQSQDRQSLMEAGQQLQTLNSQIDDLQTQVNQDKSTLNDLETLTIDLKKQTALLKNSFQKIEGERNLWEAGAIIEASLLALLVLWGMVANR